MNWEQLMETRTEAENMAYEATDVGFGIRAVVLALLYVGDCIRSLSEAR